MSVTSFWDIYESKQLYVLQKCEEEIMVSSEMTCIGIGIFYFRLKHFMIVNITIKTMPISSFLTWFIQMLSRSVNDNTRGFNLFDMYSSYEDT